MSAASREALGYCAETCPEVDASFADLLDDLRSLIAPTNLREVESLLDACCERVKEKGTLLLRAALIAACDDKQDVERDRDELEASCRALHAEVADLKAEVAHLEDAVTA